VNVAQPAEGDQLEESTLSLYEGPPVHSTNVAPQNEIEQGIAEIYQQLLGIQSVGRFDDFFELGGHSLLATQLMARLRDTYDASLPMRSLLDAPTVAGIAEAITAATSERSAAADVQADAVLDSTIAIDLGQTAPATRFQHVLLTGATGFFGAFLLADLLKRTSAHVHCLVRADSADQAMERVEQALVGYDLWQGGYRSRITPIRGDLAAPRLGLSAEAWKMLGESVDTIIHNGAVVNFITPYHRLKPANVLGTQEIIRLAARRGKPLHFVSSVGVLTAPPEQAITVFDETFVGGPDRLHSGYARSKWVAEQLVRQAGQRGLPIAIYRPGNLAGHSVTGACNTNDFLIKNMQSWIGLGIAPDLDALLDITPVDYVSAALVELAQRHESVGKTFHLVNPEPTRLRMIMEWMQHYGYQLALIPANRWQSALVEQVEQHPDTALYPLLPMLIDRTAQNDTTTPSQGDTIAYGCQFTLAALKGTGITCPPMTEELLEIYFDYCIRKELLPSVAQTRAHQEGAL
jgi:thioester reductase-like protein